mmetsp:Transcript_34362/g.33564  ORF Transcript_34362/g.33564 Transcript_34362/m.33564 type:complete len:83 (+) Transcript_34362:1251-1499(+)
MKGSDPNMIQLKSKRHPSTKHCFNPINPSKNEENRLATPVTKFMRAKEKNPSLAKPTFSIALEWHVSIAFVAMHEIIIEREQ